MVGRGRQKKGEKTAMRATSNSSARLSLTISTALFLAAVPLQVDLISPSIDSSTAVAAGAGGGGGGGGGGGAGGGSAGAGGSGGAEGAAGSETSELAKSDATTSVDKAQEVVGSTPGAEPSADGLDTASMNAAEQAGATTAEETEIIEGTETTEQ